MVFHPYSNSYEWETKNVYDGTIIEVTLKLIPFFRDEDREVKVRRTESLLHDTRKSHSECVVQLSFSVLVYMKVYDWSLWRSMCPWKFNQRCYLIPRLSRKLIFTRNWEYVKKDCETIWYLYVSEITVVRITCHFTAHGIETRNRQSKMNKQLIENVSTFQKL